MLKLPTDPTKMTHMPFLAPTRGGAPVLFYCQANKPERRGKDRGRPFWKLHYIEPGGEPKRLETGLPPEMVECSPTAWLDEAGWHVTFVGGEAKKKPMLHLYRMDGPSLDEMGQPVAVQATRAGFVFRDRLAFGEPRDVVRVREPGDDQDIELPGAHLLRISYRPDRTDRILITGQWIGEPLDDGFFCLEYDLKTGEQHFIECEGKPAYKCAILGHQVVFADRTAGTPEERALRESTRVVRRKVRSAVRMPGGTATPGEPARPCTGCGRDSHNTRIAELGDKHQGCDRVDPSKAPKMPYDLLIGRIRLGHLRQLLVHCLQALFEVKDHQMVLLGA